METSAVRIEPPRENDCDIVRDPLPTQGLLDFRVIELLFFAYREFTADADSILVRYGFGRAHHRVLHFVNRAPGLTIAELLDILQITKQSLSRVLRQLIDENFVVQIPGDEDRRQRRLYPTEKGRKLAVELSRAQVRRIDAALTMTSDEDMRPIAAFLKAMASDREAARDWFERQDISWKDPE
ncbi:MarR family transcriptional regulator [Jiella sp. MQZ9-1]|uniref:MarR family transcriptional regulator n=1 Tax=Jiella flava TaxID=2816857 RepID=A0A939G359_9HYPH|nr:MarR family transcriptional regulator [Jiella flava]MBO0664382.1 MarR family transcriptional regulator [Jiella flava]MCD2473017.1 MarR family transcriptional regulator [Jiella flava]